VKDGIPPVYWTFRSAWSILHFLIVIVFSVVVVGWVIREDTAERMFLGTRDYLLVTQDRVASSVPWPWGVDGDGDEPRRFGGERAEHRVHRVTAAVPATAPPSISAAGKRVTFRAANLTDGDGRTAWRMIGDGTGQLLTFEFTAPIRITRVGLVNGYAKSERVHGERFDWYAANRRVLEVEWRLGDGTTIRQTLRRSIKMQTVKVQGVRTTRVQLKLLRVSRPGAGRLSRDYTAVSEVLLVGLSN
jgi:hypothetical protein